jgi:hypothetical protein
MKMRSLVLLAGCAVMVGVFVPGCESDGPGSHTLSLAGTNHLEGHTDPLANCIECHGATLNGGRGPSCYECHDNADHTTVRGGRRHRAGNAESCTVCHGPDNGGGLGPACSLCH